MRDFDEIYPGKFNNKTNGITFRRWLLHCNHELSQYIQSLIGNKFLQDATKLKELLQYINDENVLSTLLKIKAHNKTKNSQIIFKKTMQISINPNSIFDIQIKTLT